MCHDVQCSDSVRIVLLLCVESEVDSVPLAASAIVKTRSPDLNSHHWAIVVSWHQGLTCCFLKGYFEGRNCFSYSESQWGLAMFWTPLASIVCKKKTHYFMFVRRKKVVQLWNDMRGIAKDAKMAAHKSRASVRVSSVSDELRRMGLSANHFSRISLIRLLEFCC